MNPTQKKAVKEVFDSNPGIDELFVTEDNQCFTNNHSAVEHTRSFLGRYPNPEEMPKQVSRPDIAEKQAKAQEVIDQIKAAESVEAVYALIEGDERTTVQKAAEARIEELAKITPPHSAGGQE